jgi:hypothetical protein
MQQDTGKFFMLDNATGLLSAMEQGPGLRALLTLTLLLASLGMRSAHALS